MRLPLDTTSAFLLFKSFKFLVSLPDPVYMYRTEGQGTRPQLLPYSHMHLHYTYTHSVNLSIMADEGLNFTDTVGGSPLHTEEEHSDTMSEILSLFQDSVPSSSHHLGNEVSEDLLTDELCTLSGDELWAKTEEDVSSSEEDAQPPPQKFMCLEEERTAAEGEALDTTPQPVETQQPTILERLGLSECIR